LFVQAQHLRNRARDLRDLERVRQARAVMIPGWRKEHLGLVLQPAEGFAVDDAIAIALKRRPHVVLGLWSQSPLGIGALRRLRGQQPALARFELFAQRHATISLKKLVPCARGPTSNRSASVCPRSANVLRVPKFLPAATAGPAIRMGTYSRA